MMNCDKCIVRIAGKSVTVCAACDGRILIRGKE